ncbi:MULTISPECIES: hypothetical protein [unclassified Nocardioides]|uniref:hypothetical protein n=1 Tax=unclassified Nocardioides TaxID=2615069 RepID=UPI0000571927|nr:MULTISPECIES: hypothetical protein [unclassified Nocardioides]ABL79671.1 hypothetical protein Noca_0126 [Nocardioides sp. JS614]
MTATIAATTTARSAALTRPHHGHRRGELPDAVAKEIRAAARVRDLVELMARRPDLAGVYGAADLAAEAVRWTA